MAPEFGVGKPTIASEPASEKFRKVTAFPPLLMLGLYRPGSVSWTIKYMISLMQGANMNIKKIF